MLDWCRNLHTKQQKKNQIVFSVNRNKQQEDIMFKSPSLAFMMASSNQIRKLQPRNNRKGIKTHFDKPLKTDKEIQTHQQVVFDKVMINTYVQTSRVTFINDCPKSQASSRQRQYGITMNQIRIPVNIFYKPESNLSSFRNKQDYQSRNDKFKQTKASYCMYQTKDRYSKRDNTSFNQFQNIESFHVLNTNRSLRQKLMVNSYVQQNKQLIKTKSKVQNNKKMIESIRDHIEQDIQQVSFSERYKKLLKNIQSEFKLSEKKKSKKQIKNTPNRKILFHDRDTIISKYNHQYEDNQEQDGKKSFKIQQSIVCQPQIKTLFSQVTKPIQYQFFTLFLAKENMINMIITIKQVSIEFMNRISKEILLYKEIQERRLNLPEILKLYQTQIDRQNYIFIKQAYTYTLRQYIDIKHKKLIQICLEIKIILDYLQNKGLYLIRIPKIQDFVVCYEEIKIQNIDLLDFGSKKVIFINQALEQLKEEIIQTFH